MNELLEKIQETGLSAEHSDHVLSIVVDWVNENYPIAGAITNNWIKESEGQMSQMSQMNSE
jgi:hypothetical protein